MPTISRDWRRDGGAVTEPPYEVGAVEDRTCDVLVSRGIGHVVSSMSVARGGLSGREGEVALLLLREVQAQHGVQAVEAGPQVVELLR